MGGTRNHSTLSGTGSHEAGRHGPAPAPDLLDSGGADSYRAQSAAASALVCDTLLAVDRPFSGVAPAELSPLVNAVDLDTPLPDAQAVLGEVGRLYLDDAVWFHHPSYVAHLNCPVAVAAVVADQVASAVNSSMDTWDQSAGATLIERRLIAWTAGRLGLPRAADGVFTSGGTASNLEALVVALGHALATVGGRLPHDLGRLRILATEDSHFSVSKSASVLGLGYDGVVSVAVDASHRMDVADLVTRLARLEADGVVRWRLWRPPAPRTSVRSTRSTTSPDVCRAYGVWMHVDAAYGGGLVTSHRHRHLLHGVSRADSVTVDFHKTFFRPVASSALLVRDRSNLRHVTYHADYLNPRGTDQASRPNQVDKSLQTTRRFDALKLWWTLRSLGPDRIGELLDTVLDLADDVWQQLDADADFEVCERPTLSTLVFRYAPRSLPDAARDAVNRSARERLFSGGEAVVAGTTVDGRAHLKLTLLNPATTVEDVEQVLGLVRKHAAAAADAVRADLRKAG